MKNKSSITEGNTPVVSTRDLITPGTCTKQKSKKKEHKTKLDRMEQLEKLMLQTKEEMRLLQKSGIKKQPLQILGT